MAASVVVHVLSRGFSLVKWSYAFVQHIVLVFPM